MRVRLSRDARFSLVVRRFAIFWQRAQHLAASATTSQTSCAPSHTPVSERHTAPNKDGLRPCRWVRYCQTRSGWRRAILP